MNGSASQRFALALTLTLGSWSGTALLTDDASLNIPWDHNAFKTKWLQLLSEDMASNGSFPRSPNRGQKGYKVVLGIFSTWHRQDIRQTLRDTWMKHPDVCTIDKVTADCTIHVAFVLGRSDHLRPGTTTWSGMQVLRHEPDVIFLDTKEAMNLGKTLNWFYEAAEHIEWADFIMKADDDVFPHVTNIIDGLPDGSSCPQAYLGVPWTCPTPPYCPPAGCGPPAGHNFTMFFGADKLDHDFTKQCWVYMTGGLYALSRQLAVNITQRGGYWHSHRQGPEDALTGRAVSEYARRTGNCVHIWDKKDVHDDRMFFHLAVPGGVEHCPRGHRGRFFEAGPAHCRLP